MMSLDEFLSLRSRDRRLARLTHDIPLPIGKGLEFGAIDKPTAAPDGWTIEYVDYASDAGKESPGTIKVDHVWSGAGVLSTLCGNKVYDFAIASQVGQFVPNLLGWFRGIFDVLRVGGVLNVSLPDKRFTCDIKRHPSTLGELLEAYYLDYARPSLRQVSDHTFGASAVETAEAWNENIRIATISRFCGEYALDLAHAEIRKALETNCYTLCHCWVFTPLSFLDLIEAATRLRLLSFVISQFSSTESGDYEFFVCLRRDAELDPDLLLDKQLAAIAHVRGLAEQRTRYAHCLSED